MNAPSSVFGLTSALVHRSAGSSPAAHRRHETFIATRLAIGFAVLGCLPLFLAMRGAPTGPQALVFAFCLTPLAAAAFVAWTGRIAAGHAVAGLGLAGLGSSLWLGLGCGVGCAATWLLAANLEAWLAADRRVSRMAGAMTIGAIACMIAVTLSLALPSPNNATGATVFATLAIGYAWIVCAYRDNPETGNAVHDAETATWRAISEAIDDVVIEFDAAGRVDRVRADAETRLGVAANELIGHGFFEQLHVVDRPLFLGMIAEAASGSGMAAARLRLRGESSPRRIEMRARRVSANHEAGAAREPMRVVAVLRVAEEDQDKLDDSAARRSVEDAIQSKDRFLANMSHELRTPLNAIIGFSDILGSHTLRPIDTAKQREYARIINQSGHHLLSVVNSILDMSKIRSGTFAIAAEQFDLIPLMNLCCDMVKLRAQESGIRLVRDYADRRDVLVGDERACKQIFINLLSNAVKFTPAGGQVTIGIRPDGDGVLVSVSDTGIGIGAEDLARLGDPFFQAGSTLNRSFEGTGLGLSVVRGLVGLHGGTIGIESEPGRGTSVEVRFPLDARATEGRGGEVTNIDALQRKTPPEPSRALPEQRMKEVA